MYKTLCVLAILLATFDLTSASKTASTSESAPPALPSYPVIVTRGKLLNQSAPFPATTIFTPTQTGLYRLSVYGTVITACASNCNSWAYWFYWSDDAGAELSNGYVLSWYNASVPPNAFAPNTGAWPGNVVAFEAVAGVPVKYAVMGSIDGSAYSLYYTIERLE